MSASNDQTRDQARDVPRVHTNAMAAHGGPFDLTLDFGYRADPADDPETQVRVTMSWEHAAAMVKALRGMVDNYEKQVGKIPDLESVKMTEEANDSGDRASQVR